ncbi:hypothetical protein L226DRAFT_244921 [Lentinus tigrinus ALCF2SS1-7]|uniref:Secreted protein n=1 Tax=Lentinus tigrinus ALCF2SS1-6 TaxID=1328759 RepID=A0A5C2SVU5_9APHY|nr:hypothetical protein L227DRAFT_209036 [Lentinus tigrinus ALCF2SS1-6]RPD79245.1 hypothetical protein L226DRAFT_244921 [Lentinus tigrinus ALCF2SS1-7]
MHSSPLAWIVLLISRLSPPCRHLRLSLVNAPLQRSGIMFCTFFDFPPATRILAAPDPPSMVPFRPSSLPSPSCAAAPPPHTHICTYRLFPLSSRSPLSSSDPCLLYFRRLVFNDP